MDPKFRLLLALYRARGAWQLYQVSPHDPVKLVSALAGLVAIALLASYLPARRAAKIDALRHE